MRGAFEMAIHRHEIGTAQSGIAHASLRTFPVPTLHEPTASNCHIARLASMMTLNVSLGGLLQV